MVIWTTDRYCESNGRCQMFTFAILATVGQRIESQQAIMATVPVVLEASLGLRWNLKSPAIGKCVTKFGRISIRLFQLMAFAGVVDEGEVVSYDAYIRSSRPARGFRCLLDLSHITGINGRNRVFTFDLTIDRWKINNLLIEYNSHSLMQCVPYIRTV